MESNKSRRIVSCKQDITNYLKVDMTLRKQGPWTFLFDFVMALYTKCGYYHITRYDNENILPLVIDGSA